MILGDVAREIFDKNEENNMGLRWSKTIRI